MRLLLSESEPVGQASMQRVQGLGLAALRRQALASDTTWPDLKSGGFFVDLSEMLSFMEQVYYGKRWLSHVTPFCAYIKRASAIRSQKGLSNARHEGLAAGAGKR
jgi:hypothetical protein